MSWLHNIGDQSIHPVTNMKLFDKVHQNNYNTEKLSVLENKRCQRALMFIEPRNPRTAKLINLKRHLSAKLNDA